MTRRAGTADASTGGDRVEIDLQTLAGVSDRGHVRARNEDAMALGTAHTGVRAAVVCDGVSSARSSELASRAACEAAVGTLLDGDGDRDPAQRTWDAVAAAAHAVTELSGQDRKGPSCTYVSATVDAAGSVIAVGWVGDSRAYWLAEDGAAEPASVLTRDHSWAAEMVAAGLLDAATAAADRRAHAITRWLGFDGESEPDIVTLRPAGPGVLVLCTDGLWNYLPGAADMAAVALPTAATAPLAAADALTRAALDAGGHDNITVVVIPVTVS